MLSDHTQEECDLHPNLGRPMAQARDGGAALLKSQERRKRERIGAYHAWNESQCTFARSHYVHVCSWCGADHRKVHCRENLKRGEQGMGGLP